MTAETHGRRKRRFWRPAPWLLAPLLVAILSTLWSFAVSRFLRRRLGEP